MPQTNESLWLTLFGLQGELHKLSNKLEAHKTATTATLEEIREELDANKHIRSRVSKYLDRWPVLAASFGLVAANADPNSVIDALVKLLEAMKAAT